MNGIEAAWMIQAKDDIPIVYLTAHSDEDTFKQAKLTGPYGYIIKPVEEKELKTVIEVALFKHGMQQQLKESQARFKEIFEQNFDAIVLFKFPGFEVVDVNPAAESIFQYPRKELVNNFQAVFENRGQEKWFKKTMNGLRRADNASYLDQCRLKRKDGTKITCSIKANIVKIRKTHMDNDLLYCSFRDITEKLRSEEETKFLQTQLIHANKMTSIGTLASGIAHEINNPNNFIMSNTQIIQQVWNDAEKVLRDYRRDKGDFSLGGLFFSEAHEILPRLFLDIIEGSRRIKDITRNLRDYSRPKDAQFQEKVNINKVLNFAISMLVNEIKKYTDAFTFEPSDGIPFFRGNPQQMEQVFINLIQNALHSLPDKTRAVHVASSFDKKDHCITVIVADQGGGIDEKLLERITDPFFTTKQDQGGTGLGLYISYYIIKQHNATLDFDSQPGKGTTVTVKVPAEKRRSGEAEKRKKEEKKDERIK
jgi:PAS domain S-box-containing protein